MYSTKKNHLILSLLFSQVAVMSLIHPGSWCLPSVLITPHNSTQCSAVLFDSKLFEMKASSISKAAWDGVGGEVIRQVHQTDPSGSKVASLCSSDHLFQHLLSLIRP